MAVLRVIPRGDLALENGTVFFNLDANYTRQKLSVRFKFFLTEWFLDLRQGVPYYRDVFVKDPNLDLIRSLFRQLILSTPGVLSLASFSTVYDEAKRSLAFAFVATTSQGTVSVSVTDPDFILDLAQ